MAENCGIPITAERVTLREFAETDFKAVHAYLRDPEAVRSSTYGPHTEAETREYIRMCIRFRRENPRMYYDFAVVRQSDDRLMGTCGVYIRDPQKGHADIGYIYSKEFWGQGYATEAARAVVAFAFSQLEMTRVSATCFSTNPASARVLQKIGMTRRGESKNVVWRNGKWTGKNDMIYYAITKKEWANGQVSAD